MGFGQLIVRFRWFVVAAWVAAAAALIVFAPSVDPEADNPPPLLPNDTPYYRAVLALGQAFPGHSGLSEADIIFERSDGPLSPADMRAIDEFVAVLSARRDSRADGDVLAGIQIRSPRSAELPNNPLTGRPLGPNPLVSDDGKATLVMIDIPANFIAPRASRAANEIRNLVARQPLPAGLWSGVTGSSAFGSDYAKATRDSERQTLLVTVIAVLVILMLVYRAPIAAMMPLAAITLAAVVSLRVLALGQHVGLHVGEAERLFIFVLIYGAGTDYCLLYISRYRELAHGENRLAAPADSLNASLGAILPAAVTNTLGMLMLSFARFGILRTTGPAVGVALIIVAAVALTLAPALVAIIGPRLFWPSRRFSPAGADPPPNPRGLWPRLAQLVTTRPLVVLGATLAILAIPAARGTRIPWVYDTLASLPRSYGAVQGLDAVKRHWPVGEAAPLALLVRGDSPLPQEAWRKAAATLTGDLSAHVDLGNIRSLSSPLGRNVPPTTNALVLAFAAPAVQREYVSPDGRAMRLQVVLTQPALTLEAIDALGRVRQAAEQSLRRQGLAAGVFIAGATAEMADIRDVTRKDFHLISAMVLSAILLILLALLRRPALALFMLASTLLAYAATLGVTYWVFSGLMGLAGLDWKVEVMLFVLLVAVGQDYNIFLTARLRQEARVHPPRRATWQAIVHTGPVISSCGLIMAATLGSLMAAKLLLLVQLGFALALGMLLDTFLIRPLLLPAFIIVARQAGESRATR